MSNRPCPLFPYPNLTLPPAAPRAELFRAAGTPTLAHPRLRDVRREVRQAAAAAVVVPVAVLAAVAVHECAREAEPTSVASRNCAEQDVVDDVNEEQYAGEGTRRARRRQHPVRTRRA